MDCSMPGFPVLLHQRLGLAQTHVHRVSDAIQPSNPLLPPSPPAFNLSQHQGLFQWVDSSIRWPKNWSFSIHPSDEYSGLISFRIDWQQKGQSTDFLQQARAWWELQKSVKFELLNLYMSNETVVWWIFFYLSMWRLANCLFVIIRYFKNRELMWVGLNNFFKTWTTY